MAELDANFEKRMKQAESEVAREFGTLDAEIVRTEFARVTDDLLRDARVTDFVPVLVHRHVREILRERSVWGAFRPPTLQPQAPRQSNPSSSMTTSSSCGTGQKGSGGGHGFRRRLDHAPSSGALHARVAAWVSAW
jgi:hypothetical protein